MKYHDFEKSEENAEEPVIEQDGLSSTEEGFMKGYLNDEDVEECIECGAALNNGSLVREVDGEELAFCSKSCADEYEEGL